MEEGFRASFLLTATFIQRGKQCGRRLRCCRQVGNILPLDGVHTVGILYIGEVDNAEAAVLGERALFTILAVLVEEVTGQCRELVIIDHHGKPLGAVLANERVDDTEGLTRSGRTQDDGSTEGVDDIDPAVVQTLLVVVDHRDIDAILVLFLVTALFERLVIKVPFVVSNLHAQVFGDGIEALVYEHSACDGA